MARSQQYNLRLRERDKIRRLSGNNNGSGGGGGGITSVTLTGDVTGTGTGTVPTTLASGIDASKIADGSVSNAEFERLDGVTSAIQTQIDSKLASVSYTAADVLTKIKTVDGSGSGLDADTLDGFDSTAFQPLDSDLTTIAGLTATTDSFMQAKSSAWAARTIAQVKVDLEFPTGAVVGTTDTQTLTNKRINPRITSTASSSSPTPNSDTDDVYELTALAAAPTFGSPTGTPVDGQKLIIRIKDNGSARVLAFTTGSSGAYRAGTDISFPTTTVISKTMYLGFLYNSADSRWDLVAKVDNI